MKLTWFGHSAFRIEFGASVLLIDPFLSGNPTFKGDLTDATRGATHVLLTHGHNDHVGDALAILRQTGAQLVCNYEIGVWLGRQLGSDDKVNSGNHGGTVECGGFTVSFVNALHSASYDGERGNTYLGNPLGLVVKSDDEPTLYHMGDTDIFGDMALIAEIYRPEIGIVPIGDRYTMGGKLAALACRRFFDFRTVIPCHYATFGLLDQTADKFIAEMGDQASRVIVPERGAAFEA